MKGRFLGVSGLKRQVAACCVAAIFATPSQGDAGGELKILGRRQCVFAGEAARFRVKHSALALDGAGRDVRVSLSVKGRRVARGRILPSKGSDEGRTARIRVDVPSVKPGVVMKALLEVAVMDRDGDPRVASASRRLYLFPKGAFEGRTAWLKERRIRVFAPNGDLIRRFEDSGIPFERIHNSRRIRSLSSGWLWIGGEMDLRGNRELVEAATAAAANGCRVVSLGFQGGATPLPGVSAGRSEDIERLTFRGPDVVETFDERFDALTASNAEGAAGPFELETEDGRVVARFGPNGGRSWHWFLAEYKDGGTFVLTSLPLVERWTTSPVPRYLVLGMLERWSRDKPD